MLKEADESLKQNGVGNHYGATDTATPLPVNRQTEQNGVVASNGNTTKVNIEPKQKQDLHKQGNNPFMMNGLFYLNSLDTFN